jgi:hypothetical protein
VLCILCATFPFGLPGGPIVFKGFVGNLFRFEHGSAREELKERRANKCVCVCVIIVTIPNVISTKIFITNCVYSNIREFSFMDRSLAQVKCTIYLCESLIQLFLCNFKKLFNMGFMVPRSHSQF